MKYLPAVNILNTKVLRDTTRKASGTSPDFGAGETLVFLGKYFLNNQLLQELQ
jgi:hypothetical protein